MREECARLAKETALTLSDGEKAVLRLQADTWDELQLKAAMSMGSLLIDKRAKELEIVADDYAASQLQDLSERILQAARIRFTRTEYISCPGCGRTLYNLPQTVARIKAATQHLVGLKIGIMGCIVNGPGEMADADYGYVGAARGKVSLYRGKECIEMNIPEDEALPRLLALIENDRSS